MAAEAVTMAAVTTAGGAMTTGTTGTAAMVTGVCGALQGGCAVLHALASSCTQALQLLRQPSRVLDASSTQSGSRAAVRLGACRRYDDRRDSWLDRILGRRLLDNEQRGGDEGRRDDDRRWAADVAWVLLSWALLPAAACGFGVPAGAENVGHGCPLLGGRTSA
jgi:hypothetical protein